MESPRLKQKANTFHHSEEASRLSFAAVFLYERKYRTMARKMKQNYVMMSWEKMAKKNCHAKYDECCFSITTLLECSSEAKWHYNFSLPNWQTEIEWNTTSFCFVFFLDIIMSGLWNRI